MAGRREAMESATENIPPMARKGSGKGEKARSGASRLAAFGEDDLRVSRSQKPAVRAHRVRGNTGGRVNPIRSKTK